MNRSYIIMNDIINFFETSQIEYLNKKDKSYLKNTSQFFTPYDTCLLYTSTHFIPSFS